MLSFIFYQRLKFSIDIKEYIIYPIRIIYFIQNSLTHFPDNG